MKSSIISAICRSVVLLSSCFAMAAHAASEIPKSVVRIPMAQYLKKPKLIVVIVIDQCRSDFLTRFEKRMREQKGGGLSYLMNHGAYFPFAKYDILQSMTCPGHATILTGAYPYQMGIPLNEWYDSTKKADVYCAEDHDSAIVGRPAKADDGLSPKRLVGSTVGDELKTAGYASKVVAVALKDRSAIMLGGHRADLAMWVEDGKWVSSKFYLPKGELPAWIKDLNGSLEKEKDSAFKWKVNGKESGLTRAEEGAPPLTREVSAGSKESFATPYGVRMTTDAALRALAEMKLGRGAATDILAISYSSHDMLGHAKGLQAPEMEELTMFEDESIGSLVRAIDKSVGLKNVVFAFTGDHGVAPSVGAVKPERMPAGRLDMKAILAEANQALEVKFGKSSLGPWIVRSKSFNFYLDPAVIADKKKDRSEIELELKKVLLKTRANGEPEREGVAQVFTRTDWETHRLPPGRWERQILKTFIPGKSGDVLLIPKPFWVDLGAVAATHVSGYNYDRTVPLILVGGGAKPGVYPNEVEVVDLAPTLSFMLGLVPPSGSDGRVLHEIF